MAGKYRTKKPRGEMVVVNVRIPPALKDDIAEVAHAFKHSMNEEFLIRLMATRSKHRYGNPETRRALLALEPKPEDDRTDLEIAREWSRIKGEPQSEDREEDHFEDVEVDWLPGSEGELWNNAS